MKVSCTRSSTSAATAPAPARKRASARACRRTSSAAAGSSPPRQAAISAASVGTAATGSAGGLPRTLDGAKTGKLKLGGGLGGVGAGGGWAQGPPAFSLEVQRAVQTHPPHHHSRQP